MAGHSKWNNIKRKKALIDGERGKQFQKLVKEIHVAARKTNGVIEDNPQLRVVVEKAKAQNMPKDNIEKAIKKAIGKDDSKEYFELIYEGYGPHGVPIMVSALTDNKNRTASLVRAAFTKFGGNLGTSGSVSYMFQRKGLLIFDILDKDIDDLIMVSLENGAEDAEAEEDILEVITLPETFLEVKEALEKEGIENFKEATITMLPDNQIELDSEKELEVIDLINALEELDDVKEVYHNLK